MSTRRADAIRNIESLDSPCLIFLEEVIRKNTDAVLKIARGAQRLWPHIKTHKTIELVRSLMDRGINHFKCATIAEAELLAQAGAGEVLVSYPLVGPNVGRFGELTQTYPATYFSALVESEGGLESLARSIAAVETTAGVFVDLDVGMGRTGIVPDESAIALCRAVAAGPRLELRGFHAYDGHNRQKEIEERRSACRECLEEVRSLKATVEGGGIEVPHMIFGGTPTFPCYADYEDAELSPGTAFLFDWGYALAYPDLPFEPAAYVVGRVISSRPGKSFTLDVGSKAIATDPAGPRGTILELPDAIADSQSEEHWVFLVNGEAVPEPGRTVSVVPTHICPTVNLHEEAHVIDAEGAIVGTWRIVARSRKLTL